MKQDAKSSFLSPFAYYHQLSFWEGTLEDICKSRNQAPWHSPSQTSSMPPSRGIDVDLGAGVQAPTSVLSFHITWSHATDLGQQVGFVSCVSVDPGKFGLKPNCVSREHAGKTGGRHRPQGQAQGAMAICCDPCSPS